MVADGSQLAVVTHWAGRTGILVMQPDGSLAHLVSTDLNDQGPAWSPDGTRLAFANQGNVVVVNADGTGRHVVWTDPEGWVGRPTWSPNGGSLAFRANTSDPATSGLDILDVTKGTVATVLSDQQMSYPKTRPGRPTPRASRSRAPARSIR